MANNATSPSGMKIEPRRRDKRFPEFWSASIVFIILPFRFRHLSGAAVVSRRTGMCFYLLKRKSGLELTTTREIFFEKASAQRKDSVEVARYDVLTLLSDSEGISCPGDCLPSAVAPQVHVHSSKVINEWYSGSRSLGKQKSRDKYPRTTT